MVKKFLFSSLLLAATVMTQGQQKYELTVKEAVELAYKNVVELKNAQIDYQIQEARNKEILGQAFPQVSGNAGAQYYIKLPQLLFPQSEEGIYQVLVRENLVPPGTQAPPPVLVPFSFQQPWNTSIGATLQQLLFQPDVFVGLQARRAALDFSSSLIDQSKEKIKDSAYKRYYAILIAEKQLHFLDEGVERLVKLYHDDSIMFVNGFAERLDLEKVQVQLNNLRNTRNQVASAVQLSYAAMKFALGISQKDTVRLREKLSVESIRDNILDDSFKYEDRPEIRTLGFAKKLGELDVKRYKLGFIPTVSAMANYTVTGQGEQFFTNESTNWFKSSFIGLNVNVPIFDGFQRKHKIQQARLNVEKVDNTISNVKQAIDFEQVATKEMLLASLTNLDLQEENMELAQKVYNSTKLKFEQGLGSSFEVLQADAEMQTAQANYFGALYNAIVAKISYQKSLGRLE